MKNSFTAEQIQTLRKNPNVAYVSESQIRFSADFKARAYNSYMDGLSMREIFQENGIDPHILGDSRIYSFQHSIRNKAVSDGNFADKRQNNSFPAKSAGTLEERFDDLQNQVAYLIQEIEFLKKNLKADMEARRSWESRHRPTKNLS